MEAWPSQRMMKDERAKRVQVELASISWVKMKMKERRQIVSERFKHAIHHKYDANFPSDLNTRQLTKQKRSIFDLSFL